MIYPTQFRKPHRLKTFDYTSACSYMVTFNTLLGTNPLSEITRQNIVSPPTVKLFQNGKIVEKYILNIPKVYPGITLDNYVIMPNHIHLLLTIEKQAENTRSISSIVQKTKAMATRELGYSIWQLDFYDVIADTEEVFLKCDQYIDNNPACWLDKHGEPEDPKKE